MEQLPDVNVPEPDIDFNSPGEENGVSIGSPVPTPSLPEPVINTRAKKMQEGVGKSLQKTTEEIRTEIREGREQTLREQAASDYNTKLSQDRYLQLVNLANKKGGPLDENETRQILDPFNPKNANTSPDSVVEKQYATKYIGSLGDAIETFKSSPVAKAAQEQPENFQQSFIRGTELTAKMEFYNKLEEDMRARLGQQSIAGIVVDTAKQMFQPYVEGMMRGLSKDVGFLQGVDVSSNMQASADAVFRLPYEESAKEARRIAEGLAKDNPQLAIRWVEYLKGLPLSERVLDGAFTYMMPFDYAALGRGIANIGRAISINKRANTAVRQLVEQADKIHGDPGNVAEVTGDLSKAAEMRSGDNLTATVNGSGDPIKVATDDTLLTFFNQNRDKLAEDPGNLRQEQVRRLQDGFDQAGKGLLQRLIDSVRINRTPMPLAVQNAVTTIKNAVKDYYPAIRNAILDVSDPLYEPRSNTYWHRITFGNFDGSLFSNEKTAQNFADLHGIKAKIVEENGPITSKETQAVFNQRSKLERDLLNVDENIASYRKKADDVNLTEAERRSANEQVKLFTEFKRTAGKELEDVKLKLRGQQTLDRVNSLKNEADLLKAENKETRKRLKETKNLPDESVQALKQIVKANAARIKANLEEAGAITSGKADVLGARADTIQQHGVGFKLVIERPLNETDHVVRDLMTRGVDRKLYPEAVSTASATGLKSLLNATIIGKLRGADDTLALNESIQRKIGTYTQSVFREWAAQEASYIRQIASGVIKTDPVTNQPIPYWRAKPTAIYNKITGQTKQAYNEFTRTLDFARDAKDPDGKPGYFFQTPGELKDHYLRYFRREPSFAEHEAYFAFVRMVEGDRVLREIAEFRNRARLGVEQFRLSARDGKTSAASEWFDGRALKKFPGGDDVLMIMSRRLGDEKIVNLGGAGISPQKLAEYRELVEQGRLKVVELYAPEHKPLRDFSKVAGNEHIRYVLTDAAESKPIDFNHVNRRGGGHFEYDYDHYIKQASFYHQYENLEGVRSRFKSVYGGDNTFMPVLNRIMGRDIVNHMHEIQRFLREGNVESAKNYTEAHLPIEFDELHSMFKPGRDEKGNVTNPALDLNEPFHVVPKGYTVLDVDHKGMLQKYGNSFKDASRSGSLNKQFQVQFNTERESFGVTHLEDIGSQGNPLYKYAPTAKMIDPITTMNKSLNRIVNTVFMDDYKMYAVEHWLREAEQYLEPVRAALARSSPFWVFTSSNDKSAFLGAAPREVVNNLLNNRYKINQFVGVPSKMDTAMHVAKQWLVDTTYQRLGPVESRGTVSRIATDIVPNWMLDKADPITFIRSMTFHEKLGLFNPAQLLVQAQTFSTILAISPKNGTAGTYATLLHQWSRLNRSPEMLRHMDNLATKMWIPGEGRWKPGQFTEAMTALERTGFERVAGEYASLNTALKTDYIGNDVKGFLNAGTIFFREGEKSVRLGAWYTAYKEYRELKPTGALTRDDIGKILQRADLLSVNMSRASNSAMNSNVFSLTTQFINYQIRMAELFMGQRLGGTLAERNMARARILTFYSVMYGAPSAIGVTGLPLQDAIRKEAIQRNYIVGENWLSTMVDQGLPAVALAMITGKGDFKKGNNYDIGYRLGSPGFTQFNDAMKSDHAWYQMLAGAAGTSLLNTLTSTNSFFHAMADVFRPNKDKRYPLKGSDFVDMFKEISTVNQAWKLIMAIYTGKWMSKNEGYVKDVSVANAFFMATFGLSPQQQNDAFLKNDMRKEEKDLQKYIMKEAIKEYRRGYQDQKDGNAKSAQDHFKRADTQMEISGYPDSRKGDVLSLAAKGYETTINSQDYQFATQDTPTRRGTFMGIPTPFTTQDNIPDTRRDQLRRQLQLDKYKGQ